MITFNLESSRFLLLNGILSATFRFPALQYSRSPELRSRRYVPSPLRLGMVLDSLRHYSKTEVLEKGEPR